MTAVATPERPPAATLATPTRLERAVALFPLAGSFLLLVVFYAWHALGHPSPWLFGDEAEYTQLARAIADTGDPARRGEPHEAISLYTYVLAPVWMLASDVETAYTAIKYLGVLLMSLVVFPVYALARMVVPRPWAVFSAVAAAAIPGMAYSRLIVIETIAYPFVALCFLLMAKAVATWRPRWLLLAAGAVLVAPEVRRQLVVLWAVFPAAILIGLWLSERARRYRASWGWPQWLGVVLLGGLVVRIAHREAMRHEELYYLATTLPERWQNFSVWPAGAFAIGLGIVPVVLGLAAMWRPRDTVLPGYRALVALLLPASVAFVLYTSVKTVYLSTVFGDVIAERNLIYLAPLYLVATALFLHRPTFNPLALGGAALLVAYLATRTPFQLDHYPYGDAPGLAVLAEANRTLALDDPTIERILVWILVATLLVGAGVALLRRTRVTAGVTAAVAGLVLAWNVVGVNAFGNGINDLASRLRTTIPEPPNWIDRATGGAETMYLGQGIADPNPILLTEFWNRSVQHVASLDATAPPPGPTPTLVPWEPDGRVANDPGVRYVVTDSAGVDVAGTEVESPGLWRLIRVDGPIRLRSATTGVYSDGWIGESGAYSRFGSGERGVVHVGVSARGWAGSGRTVNVVVKVGRLVTPSRATIANPCRDGVCASIQPRIAETWTTERWPARGGAERVFRIPVTTPFRVEVSVDKTFSPRDFGGSDSRQLGVQVGFDFRPAAR